MNKLNNSVLPLVGLSVVLSLSAVIAVAAHWPDRPGSSVAAAAVVHRAAPVHAVSVVMHDPGCHWFQTANGMKRAMTVKGPVKLTNSDEAAIKIVGASGTKRAAVGAGIRLGPGTYRITMVGQASDDNHLKLTVS